MTPRVVLLTRSLERGGTERQVANLARRLGAHGLDVHVVSMYGRGEFLADVRAAGVPVHVLGKGGRRHLLGPFLRLVRVLRRHRVDVVYSFLAGANLAAVVAAPLSGRPAVVWGMRDASGLRGVPAFDRVLVRCSRVLAPRADAIVCNSASGLELYRNLGYPSDRLRMIANGVDTDVFHFESGNRHRVRDEWNAGPDDRLVGIVGRPDTAKNHELFLVAGAMVCAAEPSVRLVVVGFTPDGGRAGRLDDLAERLGIASRVVWAGDRADMPAVYSALDVLVSTSRWEGAPNAVLEAAACSLPVVATAAGDTPLLLGPEVPTLGVDAGAEEVARAIVAAIRVAGGRDAASAARVRRLFRVEASVSETAFVLRDLARRGRRPASPPALP